MIHDRSKICIGKKEIDLLFILKRNTWCNKGFFFEFQFTCNSKKKDNIRTLEKIKKPILILVYLYNYILVCEFELMCIYILFGDFRSSIQIVLVFYIGCKLITSIKSIDARAQFYEVNFVSYNVTLPEDPRSKEPNWRPAKRHHPP